MARSVSTMADGSYWTIRHSHGVYRVVRVMKGRVVETYHREYFSPGAAATVVGELAYDQGERDAFKCKSEFSLNSCEAELLLA